MATTNQHRYSWWDLSHDQATEVLAAHGYHNLRYDKTFWAWMVTKDNVHYEADKAMTKILAAKLCEEFKV